MTNHPVCTAVPRNFTTWKSFAVKRWISGNKQIVEKRKGADARPPPSQVNFYMVRQRAKEAQ